MSSALLPPLIAVVGQTASGKSDIACALAHKFNGAIVNADSRQLYRDMNIGTAKPLFDSVTKDGVPTVQGIPHYCFDIADPCVRMSVPEYKQYAVDAIARIHTQYTLPILVGGTGLYVQAVVDNMSYPHVPPDEDFRKKMMMLSLHEMTTQLHHTDEAAYMRVDLKNPRRVLRALEVAYFGGSTGETGKPFYAMLQLGVKMPREQLYARINSRVDDMIHAGLIDEVDALVKKYGADASAFDAIGYRECIHYIQGGYSREDCIEDIKKNTRNYAKRQATWFNKDTRIVWVSSIYAACRAVDSWLNLRSSLSQCMFVYFCLDKLLSS